MAEADGIMELSYLFEGGVTNRCLTISLYRYHFMALLSPTWISEIDRGDGHFLIFDRLAQQSFPEEGEGEEF